MRSVGLIAAFALLVCFLVSCGGGSSTSPIAPAVEDSAVTAPGGGGGSNGNSKPVSLPGASLIEGSEQQMVHLFDDRSYDSDGEIVKWEWNLGNGGWHDFTETNGDAWHTYEHPGTQVAHLRVTDNDGNTATEKIKITDVDGAVVLSETISIYALMLLDGDPGDPINDHLPDIEFPQAKDEDYLFIGDSFRISFKEFGVVFKDATTIHEASNLLRQVGASIIGCNSDVGLFLMRSNQADVNALFDIIETINQSGLVDFCIDESGGSLERLAGHHEDQSTWQWTVPDYIDNNPSPTGGNWGLETIRAPQAWNLSTYSKRGTIAEIEVKAGVIDSGADDTHQDLSLVSLVGNTGVTDHGTMVSGIIGADFSSSTQSIASGVEGISPWLSGIIVDGKGEETWSRSLNSIIRLLRKEKRVVAVNNSYGLSELYSDHGINPQSWSYGDWNGDGKHDGPDEFGPTDLDRNGIDDTYSDHITYYGEMYFRSFEKFALKEANSKRLRAGNFMLVASAGNAGSSYNAVDNSAICNAAINHQGRYIAVEASGPNDRELWSDSDKNGSVSAPGAAITSTSISPSGYKTDSGTSYAAPLVTGLICNIWKLDPGLNIWNVRELVLGSYFSYEGEGGASQHIDAFSAVTGIDEINEDKTIQRALVDVDDGTYDGNLRADPFNKSNLNTELHPDNMRGDGKRSIRDFRPWRDAYLAAHKDDVFDLGVDLDGDEWHDGNPKHFKKDYNFDGAIGSSAADPPHPGGTVPVPLQLTDVPDESVFSRYDFNGDGTLVDDEGLRREDWAVQAPYRMDPDAQTALRNKSFAIEDTPGMVRDIDVLASTGDWQVSDWVENSDGVSYEYFENMVVNESLHDQSAERGWSPYKFILSNVDSFLTNKPAFSETPDYIHSCDLHIKPDWSSITPYGNTVEIKVESQILLNDWEQVFDRTGTFSQADPEILILTMPIWTGIIRITATVNGVAADPKEYSGLNLGQDVPVILWYVPRDTPPLPIPEWETLTDMPHERDNGFAVTDGTFVYALGRVTDGIRHPQTRNSPIDIYNPVNGEWYNPDRDEVPGWYTPANGWTNPDPAPFIVPDARNNFTGAIYNNSLYIIGGWIGSYTYLNSTLVLDLGTGTWSSGPAMNRRRAAARAITSNGKLYVIGGSTPSYLATVEVLDSPGGVFRTAAGSMPQNKVYFGTGTVGTNIYALGGFLDNGGYTNRCQVFDTVSESWQEIAPLRYYLPNRCLGLPTVIYNDELHVVHANWVQRYDQHADNWILVTTLSDDGVEAWTTGPPTYWSEAGIDIAGRLYEFSNVHGFNFRAYYPGSS